MAERVRRYGYVDERGRHALYSTVKVDENSHRLKFSLIHENDRIDIEKQSVPVAFYKYMDINKRLEVSGVASFIVTVPVIMKDATLDTTLDIWGI